MAKDTRASEELTAITEQAAKQAHDAVDAYFDFFKKAISSCPSGEMKLDEKFKSHAEQDVTALQEYVERLRQVRSGQGAIRIQTEFMQSSVQCFRGAGKGPR